MKAKWGLMLLAFCITACSQNHMSISSVDRTDRQKGEEKTKLEILYSKEDITWSLLMDDLCSKFESENPDIDFVLQDSGTGIYEENPKVKEALNEFPDIFEIWNQESYIENNRLELLRKHW